MTLLPTLKLGLANQWILLLLYAVALILSVMKLPKDRRQWLFEDPKASVRGIRKLLLRLDQLLAMAILVALSLTPVWGAPIWLCGIGWLTYLAGITLVVSSIYYFGRGPSSQPVVEGPYRFSRNPQWVGLFLVFLGLAISGGSAILVLAVLVFGSVYHIQIVEEERACRTKYGQAYEEYLRAVPRYVLFK